MSTDREAQFEAFLGQHDQHQWTAALDQLSPSIHEVDRNASRIWFAFHPLVLADAIRDAQDAGELERSLWLQGRYRLADQADSSHWFLYGHRFWPETASAVVGAACEEPTSVELAGLIGHIADRVATSVRTDRSLVVGITAVALMTLQQVGMRTFAAAAEASARPARASRHTPDQIVRARARDDSQGLLGFLKGERKSWTVTFDETDPAGRFSLIQSQELTTAAASDPRDHRARDPRCHEGAIPAQCRSAFCGTCWVGVLGGAEKLSPVADLERRRIREFGYIDTDEPTPIIRLACQAQAFGAVSIVIPPWNGILGPVRLEVST